MACITRIIKSALPDNTQVTREAKTAFSKAAGIFIIYLTTCANDVCKDKKRQTVSAADVMQAFVELELDEMKEELQEFLAHFRANEGSKRKEKAGSGQDAAAKKLKAGDGVDVAGDPANAAPAAPVAEMEEDEPAPEDDDDEEAPEAPEYDDDLEEAPFGAAEEDQDEGAE